MKKQAMKKVLFLVMMIIIPGVSVWAMSPPPMMSVQVTPTSQLSGLSGPPGGEGGVSFFVRQGGTRDTRRSKTTDVANPDNEKNQTVRYTLLADYPFGEALTGILAVPYVYTYASYTGVQQTTNDMGDISLLGKYWLYSGFSGIIGVELSTGETTVKDRQGNLLAATQQPGSGTTDWIIGGTWFHKHGPSSLYGDLVYKINGSEVYQFGNPLTLNLGFNTPIAKKWSVLGEINGEFVERDHSDVAGPGVLSGGDVRDTGGETVFVSPGLLWNPSPAWGIQAGVQLPIYQNLKGTQLAAEYNINLGLSYRFGMNKSKMMDRMGEDGMMMKKDKMMEKNDMMKEDEMMKEMK